MSVAGAEQPHTCKSAVVLVEGVRRSRNLYKELLISNDTFKDTCCNQMLNVM